MVAAQRKFLPVLGDIPPFLAGSFTLLRPSELGALDEGAEGTVFQVECSQRNFRASSAGASLADARARGSYMGFSRLGLAFGGALGYAGGGWLFDAGKAVGQPELPWLMLGAIGVITFLALWWQFSPKRSASGMLEPRT